MEQFNPLSREISIRFEKQKLPLLVIGPFRASTRLKGTDGLDCNNEICGILGRG